MKQKLIAAFLVASAVNTLKADELYEAESAKLINGTVFTRNQNGFSGRGFVDFVKPNGETIQWSVSAKTAGMHNLSFRYALDKGERPLQLQVNGIAPKSQPSFAATGGWNKWNWVTVSVPLRSGMNEINLVSKGKSGGNLDCLYVSEKQLSITELNTKVTPQSKSATPAKVVKPKVIAIAQAETAKLTGAKLSRNQKGYTGNGFVDYVKLRDESIEWSVNSDVTGEVYVAFRYSLGAPARALKLQINGAVAEPSLAFEATNSWTSWKWEKTKVSLKSGKNTLILSSIGKSGANLDCMVIAVNDLNDQTLDTLIK